MGNASNLVMGRRARKRWPFAVGIACLMGIVFFTGIWRGLTPPSTNETQPITLTIERGLGVTEISQLLEEHNLIRSPFLFGLYLTATGQRDALQAGDYQIPPGSSVSELADMITGGEVVDSTVWVTIPEGLTASQITDRLVEAGVGEAAQYNALITTGDLGDYDEILREGKPRRASLEGYLFPDTYEFYLETTPAEVVATMVQNFEQRLTPELRQQIAASDLTFFEILTLASIVEKEVGAPEDRGVVAGIFLKRLEEGMRLQSDATINYITKAGRTRPTATDLNAESPYNTYRNDGLPPGPIANPGIDSIQAVLDPTPSPYYFFLTTPAGDPIYSKNFEEHTQNKAKYYP